MLKWKDVTPKQKRGHYYPTQYKLDLPETTNFSLSICKCDIIGSDWELYYYETDNHKFRITHRFITNAPIEYAEQWLSKYITEQLNRYNHVDAIITANKIEHINETTI